MGLIHSRASKKRNKAEAEVLREQAAQLRKERLEAEELENRDKPLWRQPTVGGLISEAARRRREQGK